MHLTNLSDYITCADLNPVIAAYYDQLLKAQLDSMLGEVPDAVFNRLRRMISWQEVAGKRVLFREGDTAEYMYMLVAGSLEAYTTEADGTIRQLGYIREGESIGEVALFTSENRSASVRAVRDSVVAGIGMQAFQRFAQANPAMLIALAKTVITRFRTIESGRKSRLNIRNIALLPLSNHPHIGSFTHQLLQQLAHRKKVALLRGQDYTEPYTTEGSHAGVAHWLSRLEHTHELVIYLADTEASPWTELALRQADVIWRIASAQDLPGLSVSETHFLEKSDPITHAPGNLFLLHDAVSGIRNSADWIEPRNVQQHVHIRIKSQADIEKAARFVTGQPVGLVLSGGGARGFAHAGVIRALHEAGIPIDMCAGSSIGAIMAALLARGESIDNLYKQVREGFRNPTGDYNLLPILSLLRGKRMEGLLQRYFGNERIEDLLLPFFCFSSNLNSASGYIHRHGPLVAALRASISLPGIFPPAIFDGNIHLDGSLLNNLPVDQMQEAGAGRIIAVDLDFARDYNVANGKLPNNRDLLLNNLFRRRKSYQVPTLLNMLAQSTTLASDQRTRQFRHLADLYFNPDVSRFSLMDWKSFEEIEKLGYEHALLVLARADLSAYRP